MDAPWLAIPSRAIAVIEHPCLVKDVDRGVASLGGPARLSKGLRAKLETIINAEGEMEIKKLISVALRPDDPFARRMMAAPLRTNDLLLKVTVPKRTGRRRKRGTSGPFLAEEELGNSAHVPASTIYRSLRDNASKYRVSLVGVLEETHRFRSMPDIQYAASRDDTMLSVRDHLLPTRYSQMMKYELNTTTGADLSRTVPPSGEFLQMPIAFNYQYEQSPHIPTIESGVVNLQQFTHYHAYIIIKPTAESVPTEPNFNLPPEDELSSQLQGLIKSIRVLLKERPIITRHLLYNKLGWNNRIKLRQAAVYCGYFFESGPWREALVSWGVDPRKHPRYRKYQTVSYLSYLKKSTSRHEGGFDKRVSKLARMSPEELKREHIFDGLSLSRTGNLFQFCDITDPLIAKILKTNDIRATCAPTFQGWYHVGTWAKAAMIFKHKISRIIGGENPDDTIYQRIAKWPELWEDEKIAATYVDEIWDRELHAERKREHDLMYYVRLAARNPAYAFDKLDASGEKDGETEAVDGTEVIDIPEDVTESPVTAKELLNEDSEMEEDDNDDERANLDDDDEDDEDDDEDDEDDEDEEGFEGEGLRHKSEVLGDESDQGSESDLGSEGEGLDGVWDADGVGDSDDDEDGPAHEVPSGPPPFGGLYKVPPEYGTYSSIRRK